MQTLLRTPLYDRHVALGARMVPFAGWEMPVQYEGVIPEHRAVRTDAASSTSRTWASSRSKARARAEFLQGSLSNDLDRIGPGQAQYTLLTNEQGGIVDDLIVYELEPERFLLIVNASNREADFAWLREREVAGCGGPRRLRRLRAARGARPALARAARACRRRRPSRSQTARSTASSAWSTAPATPARLGVELLVPAERAGELWDRVLERGAVPCGLGARDTLRLEVCYPLHGNDIGPETDAISAGLGWVCCARQGLHRRRRSCGAIKEAGPERRLAAFVMDDRAIPRQGMPIVGGGEVARTRARTRRCSSAGSGWATSGRAGAAGHPS